MTITIRRGPLLLDEDIETVSAASVLSAKRSANSEIRQRQRDPRTASGKQCTIANSRRASYGYDQRIEVHGSKGSVSAENTHEANITVADEAGYHAPPLQNFFMDRYAAAYRAEIAAFASCLRENRAPPVTGRDGLLALVLAEAAARSVDEGRTVKTDEIAV